jgi:hypothetical protein
MRQGREQPSAPGFELTGHDRDAPTQQLGMTTVGDRCVNCGAPLSSDQRYCVNCGERRGKPRFALAEPGTQVTQSTVAAPRSPRRPRASSGFTLIAGIATLLLAMGVGVLIGHNSASNGSPRTGTQPVNITLNGGGSSGAATTPTTATTGNPGASSKSSSKSKSHAASTTPSAAPKPTAAQATKASGAASKVLGGGNNTAGATVTQGGSCAAGSAGCQGGHLTGNYFGQ